MNLKWASYGAVLMLLIVITIAPPASAQTPSAFSFALEGSSPTTCWFYGVTFNATQGQQLTVQWSENPDQVGPVSLNFYIAPLASIRQLWLCDEGPVYLYWNDGAYGTANWAPPSTGGYVALLVNYSYHSVSGMISVTASNATIPTSPIGPAPVRRKLCPAANCLRG